MLNNVQQWIKEEGVKYLKDIGIDIGQILVDFGCNVGHYAIPAAKLVGSGGIVYALDQDESAIEQLKIAAEKEDVSNIHPIITHSSTIDLPVASVDVVLVYDMLHYLETEERIKLYRSINTVLKDQGMLSVYPKHSQSNSPMWHLSEIDITNIIKEIENSSFVLVQKAEKRLIHDDTIEKGTVINFRRINYKFAVPTNDGINIFKGMLGQAENFNIYEIDNKGNYRLIEKRLNPYVKTLQHLKTLDVYNLIDDCSIILSAKIGKKGIERLKERNVSLIFRKGEIESAVNDIIDNNLFSKIGL